MTCISKITVRTPVGDHLYWGFAWVPFMRILKRGKKCTTSAPALIIQNHIFHTLKAIILSNARHWSAYSRTLFNNQSTIGNKQGSACALNSNKMMKLLNSIAVSRESFCQFQTRQSKGIFRRFRKMEKSKISFVMSALCPSVLPFAWNKSTTTVRIFMKVNIWAFFENLSTKFKLY